MLQSSHNFCVLFVKSIEVVLEHILRLGHFFQLVFDLCRCKISCLLVCVDSINDSCGILTQVNLHLRKHFFGIFGNGVGESEKLIVSRCSGSFLWAFECNDSKLIFIVIYFSEDRELFIEFLEQVLSVSKSSLINLAFLLVQELVSFSFDSIISLRYFSNQEVQNNDKHHKFIEEPERPNDGNGHASLCSCFIFPNTIVNNWDVSDWVSEDLDQNDDKLGQSWVNFSLILKICSHDFNNKAKEEDEDKEDSKEWNEIKEHCAHHLNQESKVVNNSYVLHDFNYSLSHADDWDDIV